MNSSNGTISSYSSMYKLNTSQWEITRKYARAVYGRDGIPHGFLIHLMRNVRELIADYGETGFGDKPEAMDTVVYWLGHLTPYKNIMQQPDTSFDWTGKVVCFSGRLRGLTKAEASVLVTNAGGKVTKTMAKANLLVFCGNCCTGKVRLAIDKETPMMFSCDFKNCFL